MCEHRPPREQDVERIASLEAITTEQMAQLRQLEAQLATLRSDLLLREENYNRTFAKAGGACILIPKYIARIMSRLRKILVVISPCLTLPK